MDIKLISLELEGFKSYAKNTKIDFPQEDSLMLITGYWVGSRIASGSGKSSILEAIAFCLDTTSSSATSLKNWDSKKMLVKLLLKKGDSYILIIKDPKLSLEIDGVPYQGLVKGAKEKLQELLGVDPEMLKAMTYRKQRVNGQFIKSTDSQIKEFLTQTIGLSEIENFVDKKSEELTQATRSLELTSREFQTLSQSLDMNKISDEEIDTLQSNFNKISQEVEQISSDSSNKIAQEIEQAQNEYKKISAIKYNIDRAKQSNFSLKESIVKLIKEVDQLNLAVCPTCNRDWENTQGLINLKTKEKDDLIQKLQENLTYIKTFEPSLNNLPLLEEKITKLNKDLSSLNTPKETLMRLFRSSKDALLMATAKRDNYNKIASRLRSLNNDIAIKTKEIEVSDLSIRLLGRTGFLGEIFDEILSDIESRTNDMLSSFPNASHCTVQINSTKNIKSKGTTKKEISITINSNGNEISLEDLSGGQQSAIELCSDLAASEVVRARSGCGLSWIALDECLNGLGPLEKESAINMIRQRTKGLVLMIEHASEAKELFDNVIEVEYTGKESRLKCKN